MSVLIKGMKMPDCCNNCEFHWEEDVSFEIMHQCQIKTGYIDNADIHSFPYDCPLVELPEKHGRLFDTDEVIKCLEELEPDCKEKAWAIGLVEWAIAKRWCIEAEGEE